MRTVRRHSARLARVGTFTVLVAMVAGGCGTAAAPGTSGSLPDNSRTTPSTAAPSTAGPPSGPPSGRATAHWTSFSFVSPSLGWVLGGTPCGTYLCASILRSSDGGREWKHISSLSAFVGATSNTPSGKPADCSERSCVAGITFANAQDGYAFGPDLFVTTDGGRTWRKESGPPVVSIEAAGGNVVRVTSTGLVSSASARSNTWRALPAPHESGIQLARSGPDVLYLLGASPKGGSYPTELWRSTDGGSTWRHLANPCGIRAYGRATAIAATGSSLGLVCVSTQIAPQQAGYHQGTALSSDLGSSFGPVRPLPHLHGGDGGSQPVALALASPTTLAVADSEGGAQSSFDGGTSWTTTIGQPDYAVTRQGALAFPGRPFPIGFETATEGHVITPASTIWTTSDSGRHWIPHRLPGT